MTVLWRLWTALARLIERRRAEETERLYRSERMHPTDEDGVVSGD